jgi:hypothetical protein
MNLHGTSEFSLCKRKVRSVKYLKYYTHNLMDMGAVMAIIKKIQEFGPRSSDTIENCEFIKATMIKE